jgi:nitrite reductase/ring-hydroxylating ferredoxin subunit
MKWIKVFPRDILLNDDFIKKIDIGGKKVVFVKNGERLFAVQSKCPHAGADLSQGWCSHGNIVCPYHRHEFDLETGRGKQGQGNYINTYPVEIKDDGIFLGLKPAWWKLW